MQVQQEETFIFNKGLYGETKSQTWLPFYCNISLSAKGYEFRIVFSDLNEKPSNESRNSKKFRNCICIVFGQHNNTCTSIGLGNPFYNKELKQKGIPLGISKDEKLLLNDEEKDYWISYDKKTGWCCIGNGIIPSNRTLLLQVKLPIKDYKWFTITNWEKPCTCICKPNNSTFPYANDIMITNSFFSKFSNDTQVAPCYGMTIVCPIPKNSSIFIVAEHIQNKIHSNPHLSPYYGVLSSSSLHMTVADLIFSHNLDDVKPHYETLSKRLQPIMNTSLWTTFTMKVVPILHRGRTIRLTMEVYSKEVELALTTWRNEIYKAAGNLTCQQPNYHFHITLAYEVFEILNEITIDEVTKLVNDTNILLKDLPPIVLGPPILSTFSNMNEFPPYYANK